jgi:transposase InsO family protein
LEADVVLKVVTMAELRLEVLFEPKRTGETVADVCRRYGISRDTYYRYRRRYLAEGIDGLEDRSRKPKTSPARIPAETEVRIVEMRTAHPRWGARRIRAELERAGFEAPAVSTVHQTLRRNGLVAAQPPRRRKADQRFEREISNDLWQIDATRIVLSDGDVAWVVDLLDDHSRYLLAAIAAEKATTDLAWDVFEIAASRYGLPRQVLSDNGLAFTGRLHGVEVAFEANLADLGVQLINASPYHPQTLGKLERFHRTLKEWLTDEGPAEDLDHLQELLDGFRFHYNRQRPHQGIHDQTPVERFDYQPQPARIPPTGATETSQPTYPPHSILRKVTATGNVGYKKKLIQVGYRWAGAQVRVIPVGDIVHIYYGEQPVRVVAIDPDHYYQPLKPRKTKRKEPATKIA